MAGFQVYVNDGEKRSGYLAATGGLTEWAERAAQFPTLAAASAHIAERGWENDSSVRPGRVTAYVSNVPCSRRVPCACCSAK